jgi:hypothetical protein
VIMAGLVLYAFLKARRERLGEAVAPVDNQVVDLPIPVDPGGSVIGAGGAVPTSGATIDTTPVL